MPRSGWSCPPSLITLYCFLSLINHSLGRGAQGEMPTGFELGRARPGPSTSHAWLWTRLPGASSQPAEEPGRTAAQSVSSQPLWASGCPLGPGAGGVGVSRKALAVALFVHLTWVRHPTHRAGKCSVFPVPSAGAEGSGKKEPGPRSPTDLGCRHLVVSFNLLGPQFPYEVRLAVLSPGVAGGVARMERRTYERRAWLGLPVSLRISY